MKLLVTGATGQVGRELIRALAPLGDVTAPDRAGMDLADADGMRRVIRASTVRSWTANSSRLLSVISAVLIVKANYMYSKSFGG